MITGVTLTDVGRIEFAKPKTKARVVAYVSAAYPHKRILEYHYA